MRKRLLPILYGAILLPLTVAVVARVNGSTTQTALMLVGFGSVAVALRKAGAVTWATTIVLALGLTSFFAPLIAVHNPMSQFNTAGNHPLGLDLLERDLLSRLLYANRNSIQIALSGSLTATLIGITSGSLLALGPAWLTRSLNTFLKIYLSIPVLIYYLIGLAFFSPGVFTVIVLLSVTLWSEPARMIQVRIHHLKNAHFVQAARMQGAGEAQIFLQEILPNLKPVMFACFLITFINATLLESILSYLGLGLPLGTPSLGHLIAKGPPALEHNPRVLIFSVLVLLSWVFGLRTQLKNIEGGVNKSLVIQ